MPALFPKSDADIELENLIANDKDILKNFEINFNNQEQTLSIIIKSKKYAVENSKHSNVLLWNAAGFINMSSFDLKVITKEMNFSTNEWAKRYFARQACQLIYELTNDLFEVLNKDFEKEIDKLTNNETIKISLKTIRRDLNQFKEIYFTKLKEIRNVASAHRDKDISLQFEIIESISWTDTINMTSKFDKIINNIGALLQIILNRSSAELDK